MIAHKHKIEIDFESLQMPSLTLLYYLSLHKPAFLKDQNAQLKSRVLYTRFVVDSDNLEIGNRLYYFFFNWEKTFINRKLKKTMLGNLKSWSVNSAPNHLAQPLSSVGRKKTSMMKKQASSNNSEIKEELITWRLHYAHAHYDSFCQKEWKISVFHLVWCYLWKTQHFLKLKNSRMGSNIQGWRWNGSRGRG